MPMAISLFAAGVIWRIMYDEGPGPGHDQRRDRGVKDAVEPAGRALRRRARRRDALAGGRGGGLVLQKPLEPGDVAQLGLTAIRHADVPDGAEQAVVPDRRSPGGITGVVWRDFKPGGGTPGEVEHGELGLPGVTRRAAQTSGSRSATDDRAPTTARSPSRTSAPGTTGRRSRPRRSRSPTTGVSWLGAEPDHARDHDGVHLGVGRLRDGGDRRRASPRSRATCSRRRGRTAPASGRCSGA